MGTWGTRPLPREWRGFRRKERSPAVEAANLHRPGCPLGHARRNLPVRHRWLTGAALDVRAGPLRRDGVAHLRSNRPGPTPPDRHHPRRRPNPSVGGWTGVRRAGIHVAITHAIRSISSDKSRSLDTSGWRLWALAAYEGSRQAGAVNGSRGATTLRIGIIAPRGCRSRFRSTGAPSCDQRIGPGPYVGRPSGRALRLGRLRKGRRRRSSSTAGTASCAPTRRR